MIRSEMESENQRKTTDFRGHVMVVPFPAFGHINPMLQLSKNLASKGMIVSFVSLQFVHPKILKAKESLQRLGLDVRLESISDEIPPHVSIDHRFIFQHMHHTMTGDGLERLILRLNATDTLVSCIVYDSFLPWVSKVAAKLNIPQAFFWTQSASFFSIYYHIKNVYKWDAQWNLPEILKIPFLPELNVRDLPPLFHPRADGDLLKGKLPDTFKGLDCLPNASWMLINSFYELERETLDDLTKLLKMPILTVGPSIPSALLDGRNADDTQVGANPWEGADCIAWLDSKPPLSVAYVSFGSITPVSPQQIEELAVGLERSQQNFLWVIRPPKGYHDIKPLFPAGLLERTEGRGLVLDWCIQLDVLSHPSVGVFVSHCGWNSTLDALSLGIPVLAFGLWADQPTNAKFMTEVWKTGIKIRKGIGGIVGREEIERCVRSSIDGAACAEARKNGLRWKELARKAMMEGGSSDAKLNRFVLDILTNVPKF